MMKARIPSHPAWGIFLPIVSLIFVAPTALGTPPTLCATDEESLFACTTGKKLVSVCASKGWSTDRGHLQYRFGQPGKPEIVIPSSATTTPMESAQYGVLTFSGGGGAYLRFRRNGYQYVVYTAISGSWGDRAGVVVEKESKRISSIKCQGDYASELGLELFEKAKLKHDDEGFDLP